MGGARGESVMRDRSLSEEMSALCIGGWVYLGKPYYRILPTSQFRAQRSSIQSVLPPLTSCSNSG